jgi:hypothetical protein
MEMASQHEGKAEGEGLARLAAELLATEFRARALNLNPRAQLVSCLMRWHKELEF